MRTQAIAESLHAAGMSAHEADAKAVWFERIAAAWPAWSKLRPARACFVPGRIELLGKHTDYAGGRSLLCAVERGFCVVAAPRRDGLIRLLDVQRNLKAEVTPEQGGAARDWRRYPAVVAERLRADFGAAPGADIAFASDLPAAAGMSSSSAFVIATYFALAGYGGDGNREAMAGYLAAAEAGVGTHGGSEDHTAILGCRAGTWSQYRFCPVRCERRVTAPEGMRLCLGVSGVTASKAGAARSLYNVAADAAARIVDCWNRGTGRQDATLATALAASPDARERLRELLGAEPRLQARVEQYWNETEVWIPGAVEAVEARDWARLGAVVAESHAAAATVLQNQVPETDGLVALARRTGAVAASSFGAGFGGSVWALVPEAETCAFLRDWQRSYAQAFAGRAGESLFFASAAGPPAIALPWEGEEDGRAVESA